MPQEEIPTGGEKVASGRSREQKETDRFLYLTSPGLTMGSNKLIQEYNQDWATRFRSSHY